MRRVRAGRRLRAGASNDEVMVCAGRELRVRQREGQQPPVVLMGGCGMAMEYWVAVRRRLDGRAVMSYDRPGLGGTHWPGHLPTLAEEVASLEELFERLGLRGAVLVAHSMASFHAEALARLRPELVSGLVMLDGSAEWYASPPDVSFVDAPHVLRSALHVTRSGRLGGLAWRLGTWLQSNHDLGALGFGRLPAIYRDVDSLAMATAESIGYHRQAWELIQLRARHPWPGAPTVMLTAGRGPEELDSQRRYARLLGARHVVVEHSRHLMMLDCPQVVVEAIDAAASAG